MPSGDRVVSLMSAEDGIVEVFVFGGPKSKLRSLAAPYAAGRAFVYLDPTKDFRKLSDFDAREAFSGLHESLKKLWAAALVAELLLKTSGGGGEYPEVLSLALETLRGLEGASDEASDYPLLLFLWRLVELLGLMPELSACVRCGREIEPGTARVYSPVEMGFACGSCAGEREPGAGSFRGPETIWMSAGATRWLERASTLPFHEALRATVDGESLAELKALAFGLARRAAEAPLVSLSAGVGIL